MKRKSTSKNISLENKFVEHNLYAYVKIKNGIKKKKEVKKAYLVSDIYQLEGTLVLFRI